tara:strand:+ start:318 stop:557 length:240 start_codon:yes stop_codon:yes gene_type:complete
MAAVLEALPGHIENTRRESGCVTFAVTRDVRIRNRFNVHEVFASEQAFRDHQARVRKSHWGRVSASAERHYQVVGADSR